MAAVPILVEPHGGPSGAMLNNLAGLEEDPRGRALLEASASGRTARNLAIYPAQAGFALADELEYLCARSIEPNVFFNPRFLAPAMPRLEDREIMLAVVRDGTEDRSRMRLLVPFSVERAATSLGVPIMRTWSNPFGPLGTPLVDHDDPQGVVEDFLSMLGRPHLKLPRVLVLPETRLDGPFAAVVRSLAASRNLPLEITNETARPYLESDLDGPAYLAQALRAHHRREYNRLRRRLAEKGRLEYVVARSAEDVRAGLESFLVLEASGWKRRERSAMLVDRFRAAFAREAVNRLAERDMVRVHALTLDGQPIASLVVFVESGVAYTWKTAYDERYSDYSPGTLLMLDVTANHLDDPNISGTDSCAVPDHPVMSRIWTERRNLATLVIGLSPDTDRQTRQAASQLHLYRETRNLARIVRNRMRSLLGRRGHQQPEH